MAKFISSDKPNCIHREQTTFKEPMNGDSYLLSCLPTTKQRETIFPAVEHEMRNFVCHNKGRTLTEVVWEINAEGNISTAEQVIKRIEKIMQ